MQVDSRQRTSAEFVFPSVPSLFTSTELRVSVGGGARAASHLYNAAPKDGTMLGFLADSLAVGQLMFPKKDR